MTLDQIALKHKTDKSSAHHNYCPTYERFFMPLRYKENIIMELGYGGYHYPDRGGSGLRTWAEYFCNSRVYSIDIHEKHHEDSQREVFFQGSQIDIPFLYGIISAIGKPNIIIDDASHNSLMTVKSFEILFPKLESGGIYCIEDLEASYWDNEEFQGGLRNPESTINRMKALVDNINHKHSGLPDFGIRSISFFDKLVFIEKV